MTRSVESPAVARPALADRILGRPMTIAALALAAALLATWVPHYLTWPLWLDADCRVMMAHAWDDGRAPYRDIVTFNFPGEMYIYWLLGHAFGWGRAPTVVHAFDVLVVVGFGAAMLLWSRRVFTRVLPGALGYLAFVWFYLGLDFTVAGQRDWLGPALAIASILLLEAGGSRRTRVLSALLFAAGFVIRPHVVLFVPAAISASFESRGADAQMATSPLRRAAEWLTVCAAGVAAGFLPLIAAGLFPDFLRALAIAAPGGAYSVRNHRTWGSFFSTLRDVLAHVKCVLYPGAALVLAARLHSPHRALVRTWAIATAGAVLYHGYPVVDCSPHSLCQKGNGAAGLPA